MQLINVYLDRMMKVLCVFGKHQYGIPALGIGTEYAAFIPALKSLGFAVSHFESWNRSIYSDYAELNKSLIETIERISPDLMLVVQMHYEIWIETLTQIRKHTNVRTICWTTDDSWKYRQVSRFIGRYYHAVTTTYEYMIQQYHADGMQNVLLTQWAAKAQDLTEPKPAKKCRHEVSFIGAAHGNRKKRIDAIRKSGISIKCCGWGWPDGPIAENEIACMMRDSVISLNFSNSRGRNQIKARNFEVPGSGGFLLSETAPGLDNYYKIGEEIDVFTDIDELISKIKYYLSEHEHRDRIARAGFERTKNEHTYELRLKAVVSYALKNNRNRMSGGKNRTVKAFKDAIPEYRQGLIIKFIRKLLLAGCSLFWGRKRGARAARRLVFELSWRLAGVKTYTASGLPGRIFPDL